MRSYNFVNACPIPELDNLKKENIQLKKANNNLEQEIAHLKSDKVKERQLHPIEDSPLPSEPEVQPSKEQGMKMQTH